MLRKKRKRSGSKRKRPPIFILFVLLVSLASIISLSIYLFFSNTTVKMAPPIYEEIYSKTNYLHEGIRKINYVIYESLSEIGSKEKDIFFLDVQTRHKNGHVWDFIELLINCPDAHLARNLQKIIARDLATVKPEITLRSEGTPDGRIICHISIKNFYTHKIVLRVDGYQPYVGDSRPKLAIIIDDLGYDREIAFSFLKVGLPLSFSVLPSAPFTKYIVREANKEGCEVMLHLPMEPQNYPSVNPGPGALFLSMDEHEIRRILDQNLREIPGARGVNNHMGSSFTENSDKVLIVLKELKKRNLFYIDSRTSNGTVGFKLAEKIGLPSAGRSVFLDNDLEPKAMKIQMKRFLNMARRSGSAIGICHPHKETLRMLEEYYPSLKSGFQVVPVSELVS